MPARLAGLSQFIGMTTTSAGHVIFLVNLPACIRRARHDVPALAVASPQPVHKADRTTVLLVEDTLTTRALETSILETAGYEVVVACDGQEAWELLGTRHIDLVVSDIDMPRMDGLELCRSIRASTAFRSLPVILVTSLSAPDDRERGLAAGASVYVVKSAFDQRRLIETIEQVR